LLSLHNVDIILLDLMLAKGISGFDIYDEIRALPQVATLPMIAVSAMDSAIAVPQVRRKGINVFIAKPIDRETVPAQVAQVLAGEQVWDAGGMNSI
jgi:CheY-like chemotaxis protein